MEIESITDEKHNAKKQIDQYVESGGVVLACGTCIKARGQESTEVCPISTMVDCLGMVEWADKTVTF